MPTLFRLLTVIGLAVAAVYGSMFAVATLVKPEPREIVEAVALPQTSDLRTGRSAAETLNSQARALVTPEPRRHRRDH